MKIFPPFTLSRYIYTKNSNSLWEITTGARSQSPREGNRKFLYNFYNYLKKLCDFLYYSTIYSKKFRQWILYYKSATEFYFHSCLYYSKKIQKYNSSPLLLLSVQFYKITL